MSVRFSVKVVEGIKVFYIDVWSHDDCHGRFGGYSPIFASVTAKGKTSYCSGFHMYLLSNTYDYLHGTISLGELLSCWGLNKYKKGLPKWVPKSETKVFWDLYNECADLTELRVLIGDANYIKYLHYSFSMFGLHRNFDVTKAEHVTDDIFNDDKDRERMILIVEKVLQDLVESKCLHNKILPRMFK